MTVLSLAAARVISNGQILRDDIVQGLHLRGFANSASWYVYYRTKGGRERRPQIGQWPALTIEGARKAARAILEQVAAGGDPAGEWQRQRAAATVNTLCDMYRDKWLAKRKPKTQELFGYILDDIIKPTIGKMRVEDVGADTIQNLVDRVYNRDPAFRRRKKDAYEGKKSAPGRANSVRSVLHKIFELAEKPSWKMRDPATNPVVEVEPYKSKKRKRVASPEELAAIGLALNRHRADKPLFVACMWTIFLTGARVMEICGARYDIFRVDRLVLEDHKTDGDIGEKTVYLPRCALEIIYNLPENADGFLFGGGTYQSFWKFWDMIRDEVGCLDLQLRDARRTFASVGVSIAGLSLDQIGGLFGHTKAETTKGYAWMLDGPAIRAVNSAANEVAALMLPAPATSEPPPQLPQRPRALGLLRVRGRQADKYRTPSAPQ